VWAAQSVDYVGNAGEHSSPLQLDVQPQGQRLLRPMSSLHRDMPIHNNLCPIRKLFRNSAKNQRHFARISARAVDTTAESLYNIRDEKFGIFWVGAETYMAALFLWSFFAQQDLPFPANPT